MGYFLKTSPENAVPGKSWGMPKTHTPVSPVKERGARFYNPEIGRWLSRDPVEELGMTLSLESTTLQDDAFGEWVETDDLSENEQLFSENNPVNLFDAIGLTPQCCACDETQKLNKLKYGGCMLYCQLTGDANAAGAGILALYKQANANCAKGASGKACRAARKMAQKILKQIAKKLVGKSGKKAISKFIPGLGWILVAFDAAKCAADCSDQCYVYDCIKKGATFPTPYPQPPYSGGGENTPPVIIYN